MPILVTLLTCLLFLWWKLISISVFKYFECNAVEEYFNRPKQQSRSRIPRDQAGPSNVSSNSHLKNVVAYSVKNGKPSGKSTPIVKGTF